MDVFECFTVPKPAPSVNVHAAMGLVVTPRARRRRRRARPGADRRSRDAEHGEAELAGSKELAALRVELIALRDDIRALSRRAPE